MVFKELNEIAEEYRIEKPIIAKHYLSNGDLKEWNGDFFNVYSPIRIKNEGTLEYVEVGKFPELGEKEAIEILDNAYGAYDDGKGRWPSMSVEERLDYFYKFLGELKKHREDIIKLLMWEIAKTLKDATSEFERTVKYIEDSIEELKRKEMESEDLKFVGDVMAKIKRSPLGVTLAMGPYNYPLNETFATVIPALLMGNTVIVKPPKRGALIYEYIVQAIAQSFPKGVFNVLYGRGETVIKPIMQSGKISVLAFIGAHSTANKISALHPKPNRLKLVYGLDAKNVGIVMPDADLELAVEECVLGSLSYNGQRCTALKLLYVHEDVIDEFMQKFIEKVDNLKMGVPFENPNITPVPDERVEYFKEIVEDAISKGSKIVNNPQKDEESFIYPKILHPVTYEMRIFKEEQFGPIIPIASFKDVKEPIETIKNSDFGQQCSIFSHDSDNIAHLIDFLVNQVSRVNINSQSQRGPDYLPFTGRKDSAVGVLSVPDALNTFSIRTLVTAKMTEENKRIYKQILEEGKSNFMKKEILF